MQRWPYRRTVLGAATLAFFATMVARLAISPVEPLIEHRLGISSGQVGVALTGMWLAYALAQFPSGLLADRVGERRVILVALAGTAVGSAAVALAPNAIAFGLGAIVLGGLAGLHFSVATTLLARTQDNLGSAIGIHVAGAPAAGLVAPVVAGWIGSRYGWRPAVVLGAAVAVPSTVLFAIAVRPTPPQRPDEPVLARIDLEPMVELLSRPRIAFVAALSVGGEFVWQATASFLPAFLVGHHGFSEPAAGVVFSAYFVVQGAGQPAVGALSDRIGRYAAAAVTTGVGVAGYALFVLADSLLAIGAATLLVGIAMSWGAALIPAIVEGLGAEERGAGFGLVRTSYMVLGATGSAVTGVASDVAGWAVAFWLLAAVLAVMFVALVGATLRAR